MAATDEPKAATATERVRDRIADRLLADADTVVRGVLAFGAMAILGMVILLSFRTTKTWDETAELLDRLLPVVSLVLGAAGGYFFRSKDK